MRHERNDCRPGPVFTCACLPTSPLKNSAYYGWFRCAPTICFRQPTLPRLTRNIPCEFHVEAFAEQAVQTLKTSLSMTCTVSRFISGRLRKNSNGSLINVTSRNSSAILPMRWQETRYRKQGEASGCGNGKQPRASYPNQFFMMAIRSASRFFRADSNSIHQCKCKSRARSEE